MAVKKDCFAWNGSECKCLRETYCGKEECRFYICKEEYQARRDETKEKLEGSDYYVRKMAKDAK